MHDLSGPRKRHADAPATCPHAIAVGGTSLPPDGGPETAWTYLTGDNMGATGGGVSSVFPHRIIPDLSLNADPATGYAVIFEGQPQTVGGTSVACPVFAGILALANQARANAGRKRLLGFSQLLPNLPDTVYRPITQGNNDYNFVTGYPAGPGCTGKGSIDATKWITAVAAL